MGAPCSTLEAVKPRTFERFVGVDLGGGKGKNTAIAVLRRDFDPGEHLVVEHLEPRRGHAPLFDAALLAEIRAAGPRSLLAIDAPLTLTACLRCTLASCPGESACVDPAVVTMRKLTQDAPEDRHSRRGKPVFTPYTQRATEIYLQQKRGMVPRETLGQGMGPLTARAAHLVKALGDTHRLDENMIEVYPKATIAWLPMLRGVRSDRSAQLESIYKRDHEEQQTRALILENLSNVLRFGPGIWREECVRSDHLFDAVMCALTGYFWAVEGWEKPSELEGLPPGDGWIWAPPPAGSSA